MSTFLASSTGSGIKLRIKAFIPLVVPIVNNLLEKQGVNLLTEDLDQLIDAVFLVAFAILELWGWLRSFKSK